MSLVTDPLARRVNYALVTGDFFAFPKDAIMNLEARLKDLPLDPGSLRTAVRRYFEEERPHIPFTGPDDFQKVLLEAARKAEWPRYGIPREDVNSVFFVLAPAGRFRGASHLLLPYCAKPLDCRWRRRDGCSECGRCSVGDMYALARRRGLTPVSITSYHHLERTLRELGKRGAGGFIGSCCEAFYVKHRRDFERLGVPGVLVDIDSRTCYELYKDAEAHEGRFDRMTRLKAELLRAVAERFGDGRRPGRARANKTAARRRPRA